MIYFIGAGSGDPELLPIKAQKILHQADAVLYTGSLVPREVLGWCREDALIVDSQGMKYPEIFAFLDAHRDEVTVRLHTGDPSLYSTLARQVAFLEEAGIAYTVVPGITAAFGAAASLGIEYTLPGVSQTMVLTRIEGHTPNPEPLRRILALRHSSLVFYLSIRLIDTLRATALEMGYAPDTPCWVVEKATWEAETIHRATLTTIGEQVGHIRGVALILLGDFLHQQERESSHLYTQPLQKEHK